MTCDLVSGGATIYGTKITGYNESVADENTL
jgi:hypothetical protein